MALAPTAAALCLCCFLMTLDVREDCSRTSGVGSGLEPEPFADQLAGDVSRHDIGAVPDQRTRPRDRNLVGLVIDLVLHRTAAGSAARHKSLLDTGGHRVSKTKNPLTRLLEQVPSPEEYQVAWENV